MESIEHKSNDLFCSGSSLATSGSTIIGENTGVFVGGLPQGYTVVRKDVGEYDCGLYNTTNPVSGTELTAFALLWAVLTLCQKHEDST